MQQKNKLPGKDIHGSIKATKSSEMAGLQVGNICSFGQGKDRKVKMGFRE